MNNLKERLTVINNGPSIVFKNNNNVFEIKKGQAVLITEIPEWVKLLEEYVEWKKRHKNAKNFK